MHLVIGCFELELMVIYNIIIILLFILNFLFFEHYFNLLIWIIKIF